MPSGRDAQVSFHGCVHIMAAGAHGFICLCIVTRLGYDNQMSA